MAKFHTCPICKDIITENEVGPVKYKSVNKYFHKQCYTGYLRALSDKKTKESKEKSEGVKRGRRTKPQAELKEALSEEEYAEKKAYYSYLKDVLGVELTPKVYALSERYISQYGMDFKGMRDCLVYLNETLKKSLTGDVVGLLPYYIDESKKWYESVRKIEEYNAGVNPKYQEKTIRIQRPVNKRKKEIDF